MSDDPKPEEGEEQEQGDNPLAPEPGSTLPEDEQNGDEENDDE